MNNTVTFEQELDRHGTIVFTNVGVSMMPLLRQGRDLMVIQKRPSERLKKLDAVLFKRPNGQYILHRIIRVLPDGYFIVGDNCIGGEYVGEEQVLGVLTEVVREGGKRIDMEKDRRYRLYVHLWCAPYRLRGIILRFLHFSARVLRVLKRLVKGQPLRQSKQ